MKNSTSRKLFSTILSILFIGILLTGCTKPYMKMNPPADSDKPLPVPTNDNSCWMHTAANMLAGAGYGTGTSLQARSDDIFADMSAQYGVNNGGWTDTALTWWLNSTHNTWTANPYTVVTVYGNKSPKYPWANASGARMIANELRRCQFVGLSISWPTNAAGVIGSGGHAITAWGDNSGDSSSLTGNPSQVRLTDSDTDSGGNVQVYNYDSYTSPNPGGANEGNGWYINYSSNHPYIKHIVTLCPTDDPSDNHLTQKVTGSYQLHQNSKIAATDLHYRVGTDVDILSYRTTIDWWPEGTPSITEGNPRRNITVDWDLTEKKIPYCNDVRITTEFVLPSWNAIWYDDVHFTYPDMKGIMFPYLAWELQTPFLDRAEKIPNVTGGYVIGSFDVYDPETPEAPAVQYRFIHQYSYNQSPESHLLLLKGEKEFYATNLRFGHSYGYLTTDELWKFENWMTKDDEKYRLSDDPVEIKIDWKGQLPYPEGEIISKQITDIKEGLR